MLVQPSVTHNNLKLVEQFTDSETWWQYKLKTKVLVEIEEKYGGIQLLCSKCLLRPFLPPFFFSDSFFIIPFRLCTSSAQYSPWDIGNL